MTIKYTIITFTYTKNLSNALKYFEINKEYIENHQKYTIGTFTYIQIYSIYIKIHSSTLKYFQPN
jgi:ubiquitin C-terminal hydrolase